MALIPYETALDRVLARLAPLDVSEVPITDAVGLVVAEEVVAPERVPPFDNTAVDGFAVRSADVAAAPVELQVVATVAAGDAPTVTVREGTCARIMTGAVIPHGADAVVMVEDTVPLSGAGPLDGGRARVVRGVAPNANVRPAGDDLPAGAVALRAGTELRPGHIGLLATVGRSRVRVVGRPRVGVISTGDELVGPGVELRPGQIRDSNRVMLLALCAAAGVEGVDLGLVPDDEQAIEAALVGAAASCDAVVTSGGVSMGDFDFVKAVLGRIAEMEWMQVAIKPAKPFAFGTIGGTPVFGLPGNPVSSLVSFELFARPGLRAMAGHDEPLRMRLPAVAGAELRRRPDGKVHFVRVTLHRDGASLVATSTGGQGSHQLAASAGADALAVVPDGAGIPAGEPVEVLPLD